MSTQQTIGLIAGQGRLPFMIAYGAKKAGKKVVCVGLDGSVDPALADLVDVFFKGAVARPGGWMRKLRKHGVTTTIMVGAVAKTRLQYLRRPPEAYMGIDTTTLSRNTHAQKGRSR